MGTAGVFSFKIVEFLFNSRHFALINFLQIKYGILLLTCLAIDLFIILSQIYAYQLIHPSKIGQLLVYFIIQNV